MKTGIPKKQLIFTALFLLISCAASVFLYLETMKNQSVVNATEADWYNENNRRSEIRALERFLDTIESEKVLFEAHFVHSTDIVPFLNTIEKLGADVSAEAEISSVEQAEEVPWLDVGVSASGDFESVYKFLKLLESAPYELEILTMDMSSAGGVESTLWQVNFKLRLLSFIE